MRLSYIPHRAIRIMADEFCVPVKWAVDRRKIYLRSVIRNARERVKQYKNMLKNNTDSGTDYVLNQWIRDELRLKANAEWQMKALDTMLDDDRYITGEMIRRANNYPIKKLMPHPVRGTVTRCFLHDDEHPSATIKNNFFYCFVCQKALDAISIVMHLRGVDFKSAVMYLNESIE